MATLSTKNIAYALYEATKDKQGKDLETALSNGVAFLANKHLLSRTSEILRELEKIIDEKEGVVRARVETSRKLTKGMEAELEKEIKERYKAKEVHLDTAENRTLLGGLKIQVGDEVIDLTLSHKLAQLQNHLTP